MALTQKDRAELSPSDFAVPGKRKLPMIDPNNPKSDVHLRMAWAMVDKTQGLTSEERRTARRLILRKAHSMGIDTAEWTAALKASLDADLLGDEDVLLQACNPSGEPLKPTGETHIRTSLRSGGAGRSGR